MDTCIFFVEKRRNVSKLRGTDAWAKELERAKRVGDTEKLRKMSKTEEERMVVIHLAEGFEEVEALTAADILRRAGKQVVLVSVTDDPLVTGAHNITVKADCLLKRWITQPVKCWYCRAACRAQSIWTNIGASVKS